jgi:hypothetical protein
LVVLQRPIGTLALPGKPAPQLPGDSLGGWGVSVGKHDQDDTRLRVAVQDGVGARGAAGDAEVPVSREPAFAHRQALFGAGRLQVFARRGPPSSRVYPIARSAEISSTANAPLSRMPAGA